MQQSTHIEIHIKSVPKIRSYPPLSLEKEREDIVKKNTLNGLVFSREN